jgi:hypothetical protein
MRPEQLIMAMRLLRRGPERKFKGWYDYGQGNNPVRMLGTPAGIGKKARIYFIYANSDTDKKHYQGQLLIPPSQTNFQRWASA